MNFVEVCHETCRLVSRDIKQEVNFLFGDTTYINSILKTYSSYDKTAELKFPLIALHLPFDEERGREKGIYSSTKLSLTIAINTLSRYTNEEREEKSFKLYLRPIYDSFMLHIKEHKDISYNYNMEIPHYYRERYDLGSRGAMDSSGKSLDDLIDAIEIENLELNLKTEKCYGIRK